MMTDKQARSDLDTIKRQPVSARLPTERRNVAIREALRRRIQREFTEMPGLSLTLAQASRLFGVAHDACVRIFSELTKEGFLRASAEKGRYGQPNGERRSVTDAPASTVAGIIEEDTPPKMIKG